MINIKRFMCNPLQENCYVVSDDTKECVIIDCGAFYDSERQAIVDYIKTNDLKPVHLLCTHGHLDHCFGNDTIYDEFGLRPELHSEDEFLAADLTKQAADFFGFPYDHPTPPIGVFLTENDIITFGTHKLKVIHTPGHTPGGVMYWCEEENTAFSGDTLFRMSIGRTDFEKGSWQQLSCSLKKIAATLPDGTVIYCGHGPKTTIDDEKRMNPYMR